MGDESSLDDPRLKKPILGLPDRAWLLRNTNFYQLKDFLGGIYFDTKRSAENVSIWGCHSNIFPNIVFSEFQAHSTAFLLLLLL